MSESDKRAIEWFLAEEAERRERIERGIRVVNPLLAEQARAVTDAYEAERQALLPYAQEKLISVVIPWWRDFDESGIYRKLFEYLSQRDIGSGIDPVAILSGPVVFPWPRISTDPVDIEKYARYLIAQQKGDVVKTQEAAAPAYAAYDAWQNLWTAQFYVAGERQFRHEPGFGTSRWPIDGGGFGYAMFARRQNDMHLHIAEVDQLISKIHPEVIIGFAEQIEGGAVYKRLHQSLQPRLTVRTVTREEYGKGQVWLAEQYWQRKQARNR